MNPPILLTIAGDHPAFAGHFPGQPIVPGVVLLDLAARHIAAARTPAGALEGWQLGQAKFHQPARPGDRLELHWESGPGQALHFRILRAGQPLASGSLLPPPS